MKITLAFLASMLKPHYPNNTCQMKEINPISGIRMYRPEEPVLHKQYCYICKADRLPGEIDPKQNYILIGESDLRFEKANVLLIPYDVRSRTIYTYLQDDFNKILSWQLQIYEMSEGGASIQELLEASCEIFGNNPLTVTSNSLAVLGYVQNHGPGLSLPYREDISNQQYIRIPDTAALQEVLSGRKKSAHLENNSILDKSLRVLRSQLLTADGRILGLFTIAQYDGELLEYHVELAVHLAKVLTHVLEHSITDSLMHQSTSSSFLLRILAGETLQQKEIDWYFQAMGWDAIHCFQLFLLGREADNHIAESAYHALSFTITHRIKHSHVFLYEQTPVILLGLAEDEAVRSRDLTWLSDYLRSSPYRSSASQYFDDITKLSMYYEQAKFAMHYSAPHQIAFYKDLIITDAVALYQKSHPADYGLSREVLLLTNYDSIHSGELVRTLYTYLLLDRSYQLCSEVLNIHRSTLRYRISLIKELTGWNLEFTDAEERMNLLFALRTCLTD